MVITDSNLVHNHLGFKHDEVFDRSTPPS
jgi:hypothetical protein